MATDESFERDNGYTDTVKAVLASSSSSSSPSVNSRDRDLDDALDYNEAFPQLTSNIPSSDNYRGYSLFSSTGFDDNHHHSINGNGSSVNSHKAIDDDLRRKLAVHEKLATTKIIEIPVEERIPDKSQRHRNNNQSMRGTAATSNNNGYLQKFCIKLQKETSCSITFFYKEQTLIITVTGRPEQVRLAQAQIFHEFQQATKHNVEIPSDFHRYIVGPRGATLKQIEHETMTRISIPSQESCSNTIIVTGAKDNVRLAEQRIKTVYLTQFNKGYERLPIPSLYHPWIRHHLVDDIQRQYNVTINVPPPVKQIDEISIKGERQFVEQARARILQFYQSLEGKIMEFPLDIPCEQHRFILGKKGAGLKEIFDKTGAVVRIPNQEDNCPRILVTGELNRIGEAITMIYKMGSTMTAVKIPSPHWMHSVVKGEKSSNIDLIRQKCPEVRIYFRDDYIDIEGPPEQVEPVRSQIQTVIDDLRNSNTTYLEIDIDPQYYKQLIGKNQSRLAEIQDQTGCDIKFPIEPNRIVKLMGTKESVEKARQILLGRVQNLANERTVSVSIDPQYYPQLIGSKGKKLDELREKFHKISIHFPTAEEKSDKVTFQGQKDDVEKCVKFVQQKVKDLLSIEFNVPRRIYPLLIGKSGTNIQRLRDATPEVRIEVSPIEETDEHFQIRLNGKKVDVEKTKKILDEHIAELAESVENTIDKSIKIDPKWHGQFFRSNKKLLIEIQKEFGDFNMKLPPKRSSLDEIVIRGPRKVIENVEKRIEQLIDQWENSVTKEIEIPSRHHGYLLDQGGIFIKHIENEFQVRIKFVAKNQDDVRITGLGENVERASEALQKLIPIEKDLEIPNESHGILIGKGGSHLRSLIELYPDVEIFFPSVESQSNVIHLKGVSEQVEAFEKNLLDRYENYRRDREARSFQVELKLKTNLRPLIIGKQGRRLNSLRQTFEVEILLPNRPATPNSAVVPTPANVKNEQEIPHLDSQPKENRNDSNQQDFDLIIRGYEQKVLQCRDEILRFVNEVESKITMEIDIDRRVHPRIIGADGKNVRDLMKKFSVEIRFTGHKDSDQVYVSGFDQEKIDTCIDELLRLEEDFLQDVSEKQKPISNKLQQFSSNIRPQQEVPSSNHKDKQRPFKVKNAPWTSTEHDDENNDFHEIHGGLSPSTNNFNSAPHPDDLGEYPKISNGSSLKTDENDIQAVKQIPVRWGPTKSKK